MNETLNWMNVILNLMLALATGLLLGVFFFGGLWWTVQKWVLAKRSALWFTGSWLLRTGVVVAGFFLVSNGHWERLLVCLLGFILMRIIVTRITRADENPRFLIKEVGHAP